jgi:hypothetical protein
VQIVSLLDGVTQYPVQITPTATVGELCKQLISLIPREALMQSTASATSLCQPNFQLYEVIGMNSMYHQFQYTATY